MHTPGFLAHPLDSRGRTRVLPLPLHVRYCFRAEVAVFPLLVDHRPIVLAQYFTH